MKDQKHFFEDWLEALASHANGKKHKIHDSRVQMFFKPATVKQTSTSVDSSQCSSTQEFK